MPSDFELFDSDGPMEKDENERELEKLVFGDDPGFYEGLKQYKAASTDLRDLVDREGQKARDGLEEEMIKGLDDADVCETRLPVEFAFAQYLCSCFISTQLRPL